MHHSAFPIYCKLRSDRAIYRILSATEFTEVQRVGGQYLVHEVVAHTYPERVRIADLLGGDQGRVIPSSADEFQRWLEAAGPR